MNPLAYRKIGHIVKPHGVRGMLKVRLKEEIPENIWKSRVLWLSSYADTSKTRAYEVLSFYETQPGFGLLKLKGIPDRSAAEGLRRCVFYVKSSSDPKKEPQAWLGYKVFATGSYVGTVIQLYTIQKNPLLGVMDASEREHLIPVQSDFIESVDPKAQQLHMRLPEGLITLL